MSKYRHTFPRVGDVDAHAMSKEISDSGAPRPSGVRVVDDGVEVLFVREADLDAGELAAVQAVVTAHQVEPRREDNDRLIAQLDRTCRRKMEAASFTFGGKRFSATPTAQQKWSLLAATAENLAYPFKVSTIDNRDSAVMSTASDVRQHAAALAAVVVPILDACTGAKADLLAAEDFGAAFDVVSAFKA